MGYCGWRLVVIDRIDEEDSIAGSLCKGFGNVLPYQGRSSGPLIGYSNKLTKQKFCSPTDTRSVYPEHEISYKKTDSKNTPSRTLFSVLTNQGLGPLSDPPRFRPPRLGCNFDNWTRSRTGTNSVLEKLTEARKCRQHRIRVAHLPRLSFRSPIPLHS